MAASLCPLTIQLEASYNAISVRSRKDWDEYLQKCLGQVAPAPSFSVVIEETVETPTNSGSSDSGKGQAPPTIRGFTLLVLALPAITRPTSSSVQEGIAIVPAIRGFDPFILPKPASRISRVANSKALEAMLPSLVVINPKTFFIVPNLQTQEGVIIRMLKSFPYEDSHRVPWKYDVSLISTRIGKEEVCSNISSGLSRLTKSGRCYTPEELEKRRKEIDKSTAEPVRDRVTTEEAQEFLKVIRNLEYNVIQQLNKSLA